MNITTNTVTTVESVVITLPFEAATLLKKFLGKLGDENISSILEEASFTPQVKAVYDLTWDLYTALEDALRTT